jgi:hypothetical protein
MARQIENAKAAAGPAARANSCYSYPNANTVNWAAMQDKARPNLLNRDAEIGRAYDGVDENKTHPGR